MTIRTSLPSLVAFPIEEHIASLNEELRHVRSEAISNGQFGGNRMALATHTACEKALARAAEIVFDQLKQVIAADEKDTRNELPAEAKDAFMAELSRFKDKIEQAQKQNSGSYFQPISVDKLTETYLAKVDTFCVTVLEKRKNAKKSAIFRLLKWALSAIGGFFKS